jgi:hypothetical protein
MHDSKRGLGNRPTRPDPNSTGKRKRTMPTAGLVFIERLTPANGLEDLKSLSTRSELCYYIRYFLVQGGWYEKLIDTVSRVSAGDIEFEH